MKNILLCLGLLSVLLTGCAGDGATEGTLIKGNISDAAGFPIVLNEIGIATPVKQLGTSKIQDNGDFALGFLETLAPGVYQLKVGAQFAYLSLDEDDHVVEINGDMPSIGSYDFTVSGSAATEQLKGKMKELNQPQLKVEDVERIVGGIDNPTTAAFIAFSLLQSAGETGLPVHAAALERLPANDPNRARYAQYVNSLQQRASQRRASEVIQVGMPAPDIKLQSPDGKTYALSDLRGQVVLLDFWASWCRPCRAENPNVVKVYNKYKDDGFTIYSVSLDGMDPRRTANLTPEQLAKGNENQKQRWINAIAQDNLTWPYHVSELRKWDSDAGRAYGVTGIPKTFLIDREGKIAAVGLRGAASIERELQRVM